MVTARRQTRELMAEIAEAIIDATRLQRVARSKFPPRFLRYRMLHAERRLADLLARAERHRKALRRKKLRLEASQAPRPRGSATRSRVPRRRK